MKGITEIKEAMRTYRQFSECILNNIGWAEVGTTITVSFEYVWNSDGSFRDDEERPTVDLEFRGVQEFHVYNHLSVHLIQNPKLLGWSHAEVSVVHVRDDNYGRTPPTNGSVAIHHASIRREGQEWISIVFRELKIRER